MDRFIVAKNRLDVTNKISLKSNMDRFIVKRIKQNISVTAFKIQYG